MPSVHAGTSAGCYGGFGKSFTEALQHKFSVCGFYSSFVKSTLWVLWECSVSVGPLEAWQHGKLMCFWFLHSIMWFGSFWNHPRLNMFKLSGIQTHNRAHTAHYRCDLVTFINTLRCCYEILCDVIIYNMTGQGKCLSKMFPWSQESESGVRVRSPSQLLCRYLAVH